MHDMASKLNIQIMLVPKAKHVVVECVLITYMMKNNEPRLMRNLRGEILLGEQVCHKGTCNVDKIPRSNLAQCNYYHKKRHLINDRSFVFGHTLHLIKLSTFYKFMSNNTTNVARTFQWF